MFVIRTSEVVGQPRWWTAQGWAPVMVQNKKEKGYLAGHTTANISGNFRSNVNGLPSLKDKFEMASLFYALRHAFSQRTHSQGLSVVVP